MATAMYGYNDCHGYSNTIKWDGEKGMVIRMAEKIAPATLAHQVAELVTVALAELSLARQSAVSENELEAAVERAESALRQAKDPLQRLTTELASIVTDVTEYSK